MLNRYQPPNSDPSSSVFPRPPDAGAPAGAEPRQAAQAGPDALVDVAYAAWPRAARWGLIGINISFQTARVRGERPCHTPRTPFLRNSTIRSPASAVASALQVSLCRRAGGRLQLMGAT
jgi:hypothetical protein